MPGRVLSTVTVAALVAVALGGGHAGQGRAVATVTRGVPCTPEQYNTRFVAQGKDCGATLHGPSSLSFSPCSGASLRGDLCSQPFSFTLAVPGASNCSSSPQSTSGTCLVIAQVASYTTAGFASWGTLVSVSSGAGGGAWCESSGSECHSTASQTFFVEAGTSAFPAHLTLDFVVRGQAYAASKSGWSPLFAFGASLKVAARRGAAPPAAKASLEVSLSAAVSPAGIKTGSTTTVTGRVTAVGSPVRGISLGQGLTSSSSSVAVISAPAVRSFSLGTGQTRAFSFSVKAVKPDTSRLTLQATGRANGLPVRGSAQIVLRVGAPAVSLSVSVTPTSFFLERGSPSRRSRATVTITARNTSRGPAENVQILSLTVVPVNHAQALRKLAFPPGAAPIRLGTISSGGSKTTRAQLDVMNGYGSYAVEALALFDDPSAPGGNGRAFAVSGHLDVVTATTRYLTIKDPKTGKRIRVYEDPKTGRLLGVLDLRDPRTGRQDALVYDAKTGRLTIEDPITGRRRNGSYDQGTDSITVLASDTAGADSFTYSKTRQEIVVLDPTSRRSVFIGYDPATGQFAHN